MKIKTLLFIFGISIVLLASCAQKENQTTGKALKGTISISGAWALYPLMVSWAEEYNKEYPDIRIDISAGGAGKGMADTLTGMVDIGMVSREIYSEEHNKGAWELPVARDAVIPTFNPQNPFSEQILIRGITKQEIENIWLNQTPETWAELIGVDAKTFPINVYTRSDACGAAGTWASYLGKIQEDLQGTGVYGDPGLLEAIMRDPFGIGYNNLNYLYDPKTGFPYEGIYALPLDLNGNGKLDPGESFYTDRSSLILAIKEGLYPSPPSRLLYLVFKGKPEKEHLVSFLQWIFSQGQDLISETGYIPLSQKEWKGAYNKLKEVL